MIAIKVMNVPITYTFTSFVNTLTAKVTLPRSVTVCGIKR